MLMIGYREFIPVISAQEGDDVDKLRQEAIRSIKSETRQYVRRQLNWINHKLIPAVNSLPNVHLYILDATDPSQWQVKILDPAISVAKGTPSPLSLSLSLSGYLSFQFTR